MMWKVVFVGPTGAAVDTPAFRLLYPFPTREKAEAHAECFRVVVTRVEVRNATDPPQGHEGAEEEKKKKAGQNNANLPNGSWFSATRVCP